MSAQSNKSRRQTEIRNRKARREYAVEETFECGVALRGSEVKSLRNGRGQIDDAFARIDRGEVVLYRMHIAEYEFGTDANHEPYRPRKLLLHKHEIRKLAGATEAKGKSLIPLRAYFKRGLFKMELALATGKKQYDRREDLKRNVALREAEREMARM